MLEQSQGEDLIGVQSWVFGASPGPPLLGEIWLQVREANVWAMPPFAGQ